jgi:general secretion pathway protein K
MSGLCVNRRGFVLLAVLSAMVGLAALVLVISLAGREAQASARNRVNIVRAAWLAEGCAERARAAIAHALNTGDEGVEVWRSVDTVVARSPWIDSCDVVLRPAGVRLNINAVDAEQLRALLTALGVGSGQADSLIGALLDWRDADDILSPRGAESDWYVAQGVAPPRNAPFGAIEEIERVRGVKGVAGLDSLLDVDSARVYLSRAPWPVLASLPGVGAEALERLLERRSFGQPVGDLMSFAAALSTQARERFLERYHELSRLTTSDPDAWVLTSVGRSGNPPVASTLELRLVRAGSQPAIVRQRSWP